MYSPYVRYTPHMSLLLTYFCQSTLSSSLRDVVDCKLFHSVHKKLRTCGADFKYYEVADLRLRTSRIRKLRTCGCGLQELRSCGLAVADSRILKICRGLAVADKAFKRPIADLRLRIKKIEIRLRICGLRT